MNDVVNVLKGGAIGTAGILANNAVGNTVSNLAGVTDPLYRQLVKVLSALSLPTLVGMVAPQFRAMTRDAMVCAIAHEGSKIVETRLLPMIGGAVTTTLTSGDGAVNFVTATEDSVKGFGYLPGKRYVGYLPGNRYFGNRLPFQRSSEVAVY